MGSKMLIDAAHPEETRVVVVRGNRIEDFDYESATRKQLRGNIYLAKITRVEPSLQAAFVDYGGNRHGFLAFSEIHPDYYQIPVADRKALLEEEAADESRALAEETEIDDAGSSRRGRKPSRRRKKPDAGAEADTGKTTEALEAGSAGASVSELPGAEDSADPDANDAEASASSGNGADESADALAGEDAENGSDTADEGGNGETIESVGSEDALEELPERARRRRKRYYKIQEVIKRRQIILVQVVKEERGNKGAALTTYLSLAGRYTVMMPNTARGGGISRKITNATDRKRLRKIASDLDVAEGMGLIIRTAGASRTKTEIKRDFEYLLRLWENIRDLTLNSTAPSLVYEEGNLIKRSIRDLYSKDIDDILVSGDGAYKEAKGFMRMLMPSHAKNVQPYKEPEPIFVRNKIERQLSAMFSPYVTLRSGGYIVLNQTEALVSIDVNSGKATREHSIEDTALKTNMEASEEVARQLRLRDLAGLIVIDFIDMEERRNNRSVERRLKDSLRHDRARIQVGRISHFGLMEMSRQRLRSGVVEGSTNSCTMCQGTGIVRSTESISLDVLRTLEDTLLSNGVSNLRAAVSVDAALYILNHKRAMLRDIETRYAISILIDADKEQHGGAFTIEKTTESADRSDQETVIKIDSVFEEVEVETEVATATADDNQESKDAEPARRRRRRRRGGRGRSDQEATAGDSGKESQPDAAERQDQAAAVAQDGDRDDGDGNEPAAKKPRRRGRRGGRRSRSTARDEITATADQDDSGETPADVAADVAQDEPKPAKRPRRVPRPRTGSRKAAVETADDTLSADDSPAPAGAEPVAVEPVAAEPVAVEPVAVEPVAAEAKGRDGDPGDKPADAVKPKPERRKRKAAKDDSSVEAAADDDGKAQDSPAAPARRGWWQQRA